MVYRDSKGNEIGYFLELRTEAEAKTQTLTAETPTDLLRKEINRRENVMPFVELGQKVVEKIRNNGVAVEEGQMLFERQFDILGRPELFFGINTSGMTLEQILEEDDKIKRKQIPARQNSRAIWSERLVIYKSGRAAPYANSDTEESQERFVEKFASKITGTKD